MLAQLDMPPGVNVSGLEFGRRRHVLLRRRRQRQGAGSQKAEVEGKRAHCVITGKVRMKRLGGGPKPGAAPLLPRAQCPSIPRPVTTSSRSGRSLQQSRSRRQAERLRKTAPPNCQNRHGASVTAAGAGFRFAPLAELQRVVAAPPHRALRRARLAGAVGARTFGPIEPTSETRQSFDEIEFECNQPMSRLRANGPSACRRPPSWAAWGRPR